MKARVEDATESREAEHQPMGGDPGRAAPRAVPRRPREDHRQGACRQPGTCAASETASRASTRRARSRRRRGTWQDADGAAEAAGEGEPEEIREASRTRRPRQESLRRQHPSDATGRPPFPSISLVPNGWEPPVPHEGIAGFEWEPALAAIAERDDLGDYTLTSPATRTQLREGDLVHRTPNHLSDAPQQGLPQLAAAPAPGHKAVRAPAFRPAPAQRAIVADREEVAPRQQGHLPEFGKPGQTAEHIDHSLGRRAETVVGDRTGREEARQVQTLADDVLRHERTNQMLEDGRRRQIASDSKPPGEAGQALESGDEAGNSESHGSRAGSDSAGRLVAVGRGQG